jgi:hypothetical protein
MGIQGRCAALREFISGLSGIPSDSFEFLSSRSMFYALPVIEEDKHVGRCGLPLKISIQPIT